MRTLLIPPTELVTGGRFNYGSFNGPIGRLNPLDANVYQPLPRWLKALRLKEWQAIQIGTERYFIIVALFNAKSLALAQVKVFDTSNHTKLFFEKKLLPTAFSSPDNLLESALKYTSKDVEIHFENQLSDGRCRLRFRFADSHANTVSADVTLDTRGPTHQVVCQPLGKGRAMYSHKGQFPLTGTLSVAGVREELDPTRAYAFLDDHKGFYPHVMAWDWVTAGGFQANGSRIGLNLTRNQALDPERHNENALWLGDTITPLPPVTFERQGKGSGEIWTIRDKEGAVDVRFEVLIDARVDLNLLLIESRYRGPFGKFSGTLRGPKGESVSVDGLYGMGEKFYLRA